MMTSLQMPFQERFWELKKVVEFPATRVMEHLATDMPDSYTLALDALHSTYGQTRTLLSDVASNFFSISFSGSSYEARMAVAATLIGIQHSKWALKATGEQSDFSLTLAYVLPRLDERIRREWQRNCTRNRDTANPMGHSLTIQHFIATIQHVANEGRKENDMKKQYRVMEAKPTPNVGRTKGTVRHVQAQEMPLNEQVLVIAGTPAKRAFTGKQNPLGGKPQAGGRYGNTGQNSQKSKPDYCEFCKSSNGKQLYPHDYPLQCPNLKNKSLDARRIFKIVNDLRLCRNCFGHHSANLCPCPGYIACKIIGCGRRHSTLIHDLVSKN